MKDVAIMSVWAVLAAVVMFLSGQLALEILSKLWVSVWFENPGR